MRFSHEFDRNLIIGVSDVDRNFRGQHESTNSYDIDLHTEVIRTFQNFEIDWI